MHPNTRRIYVANRKPNGIFAICRFSHLATVTTSTEPKQANLINVDNAHKLVRKYAVTDASDNDSKPLGDLLDNGNTIRSAWTDSAYRSEATEAGLQALRTIRRIAQNTIRLSIACFRTSPVPT